MPATDDYGVHECLHMASFFADAVDCQLVEHESIKTRPVWLALAEQAREALAALYQAIGKEHLG